MLTTGSSVQRRHPTKRCDLCEMQTASPPLVACFLSSIRLPATPRPLMPTDSPSRSVTAVHWATIRLRHFTYQLTTKSTHTRCSCHRHSPSRRQDVHNPRALDRIRGDLAREPVRCLVCVVELFAIDTASRLETLHSATVCRACNQCSTWTAEVEVRVLPWDARDMDIQHWRRVMRKV
jgi:hypothetical protein